MRNDKPYISFSFDDFPRSALRIAGPILKEHGIRATYYASFGLMGQDSPTGRIFLGEDLDLLLAEHHELGCHTFDHCHAWDTPPSVFEKSVVRNREALLEQVPGGAFKTLSYPLSGPRPATKVALSSHFSCCRGGGQTFNEGSIDLNHLRGFFIEQNLGDPDSIREIIERTCQACGWLILATHDVCEQPTRFGCPPNLFADIVGCAARSGASILPVGSAWEEISGTGCAGEAMEQGL